MCALNISCGYYTYYLLEPMSTTLSEANDGQFFQTRQVNLGLIACIFFPQVENCKLENILEDNNQNGGFGGQSGPMENILLNGEHLTVTPMVSCDSGS